MRGCSLPPARFYTRVSILRGPHASVLLILSRDVRPSVARFRTLASWYLSGFRVLPVLALMEPHLTPHRPFLLRSTRQEPPAYVIGPATHVAHALNALVGFHANRVEATVMSVMDSAMVGVLSIRRAEPIGNVLIVSQSYEVRRDPVVCVVLKEFSAGGCGCGEG